MTLKLYCDVRNGNEMVTEILKIKYFLWCKIKYVNNMDDKSINRPYGGYK